MPSATSASLNGLVAGCSSGSRTSSQVARMAGVDLPIEARRRYTYIFSVDTPLDQDLPLTIDPTGVHLRSYGAHDYLVGCPPIGPDTAVDVDDFTYPGNVWEDKMLPVIANRVPQLGTAKVTESWNLTPGSSPVVIPNSGVRKPEHVRAFFSSGAGSPYLRS